MKYIKENWIFLLTVLLVLAWTLIATDRPVSDNTIYVDRVVEKIVEKPVEVIKYVEIIKYIDKPCPPVHP